MRGHPIEELMSTAMENIRDMVDVTTIVGDPVEAGDGSVLIPVSKVSFGFAAGGGEYCRKDDLGQVRQNKYPFAGGSGAGVTISPVAFMVIGNGGPRMLQVNTNSSVERILDLLPGVIQKISDAVITILDKPETEK